MTEPAADAMNKAMKLKKRFKARKPNFVRPESWRYYRLKENWRRPRGLDHKVRLKYAGWPPAAGIGYRTPKIARGMHPSGYKEVLVFNADQLKELDPETEVVRIAHAVGMRKRAKIIAEARKKKMKILNVQLSKEKAAEEKKPVTEEEKLKEKEEEKIETEEMKKEAEKPKRRRIRARKPKEEAKEQ